MANLGYLNINRMELTPLQMEVAKIFFSSSGDYFKIQAITVSIGSKNERFMFNIDKGPAIAQQPFVLFVLHTHNKMLLTL